MTAQAVNFYQSLVRIVEGEGIPLRTFTHENLQQIAIKRNIFKH